MAETDSPSIAATKPESEAESLLIRHDETAVRRASAGSLSTGAAAAGAIAIGALAIGRLAVGRMRVRELTIDRLKVGALEIENELSQQ